ncbi:MAG TPA: LacI family DNA-binding transcriptional regulator [Streptosporangiaceae bacterium]
MGSSRPTIRDVARTARVSTMTVSRVANGQDEVNPQTEAGVRQVIRTLGSGAVTVSGQCRNSERKEHACD